MRLRNRQVQPIRLPVSVRCVFGRQRGPCSRVEGRAGCWTGWPSPLCCFSASPPPQRPLTLGSTADGGCPGPCLPSPRRSRK